MGIDTSQLIALRAENQAIAFELINLLSKSLVHSPTFLPT